MTSKNKITGETVNEAAGLQKCGKAGVTGGFSSHAVLYGPDILFERLACVYEINMKLKTMAMQSNDLPSQGVKGSNMKIYKKCYLWLSLQI